jgi:PKD repeat protein
MRRALAVLLLLGACTEGGSGTTDAGGSDRRRPGEGLPPPGETGPAPVIDFAVQGCTERTADRCAGPVPLTLTFSAVLQGDAKSLTWDFGDGTEAQTSRVVTHTYTRAGSFTVTLGAVTASGSLTEQKAGFVDVRAAPPGGACSDDGSCLTGTCVCYQSCAFPLSEGLCLASCDKLACDLPGTTCIDLSVPGLEAPPPWRTRLCLPACKTDKECRPGFLCRLAPSTGGWAPACLPPFPRSVAEPCRTASGAVDPAQCLGGICLDVGASGYCSASCTTSSCLQGPRCARLGPAGPLVCLQRCTPGSCSGDAQLDCELPDPTGQLGFEIIGPADPAGTRYCAPKRCSLDSECGSGGRCDLGKGGFCGGSL